MFAAAAALATLAATAAEERWFEMRLGGIPSGYVHEVVEADDAAAVRTTVESAFVVNRLGASVELAEREVSIEDREGRLVSLHVETRTSKDSTVVDVAVRPGELVITTGAGGRSYQRVLPETRPLLGPEGIRRQTERWLADPSEPLHYATFVAELGAAATATRRINAAVETPGGGGADRAVVEVVDGAAEPSQLRLDAQGRVVEESEQSPFGLMVLTPSTAAARAAALPRAAGPDDPDLLVHANIRLPQPTAIERLRLRIDLRRPEVGWPDLEGPGQRIIERSASHVVLEVTRPSVGADSVAEPATDDPLTAANFILQSDHPDVVALARQLQRPGLGRYAQARLLQDWVATHMQFDPGLALVPASEAVRDRRGTCVGYAVLLATLARSLGIPTRLVMGYVYAANVFGGHAWVEIRVADRWIPLDAAIYSPGPADAARIAVVRHSAELGAASGAREMLRLFGNASIRIEGYSLHGTWVTVPGGARPYTIDGDEYRNPWLGLSVRKPAGFTFVATDAFYPDATVVGLRGPRGGQIRVEQRSAAGPQTALPSLLEGGGYRRQPGTRWIDGRAALRGAADGGAALVIGDGSDFWLLEARGVDALAALDAVAASVRLRHPRN